MGQEIRGFPRFPKHSQTVTLGSRRYRIELTWRQRASSWYMSLFDSDGNPLALGRRLSARVAPIANVGFDVDVAPSGNLFIRGADGYIRDALGDTLVIVNYEDDELPTPATAPSVVIT